MNRTLFSEYTFFLCFEGSTSLPEDSALTATRAFADRACGNINIKYFSIPSIQCKTFMVVTKRDTKEIQIQVFLVICV
jgi:hypothetical protein